MKKGANTMAGWEMVCDSTILGPNLHLWLNTIPNGQFREHAQAWGYAQFIQRAAYYDGLVISMDEALALLRCAQVMKSEEQA
jgi:hypothetical protein